MPVVAVGIGSLVVALVVFVVLKVVLGSSVSSAVDSMNKVQTSVAQSAQ